MEPTIFGGRTWTEQEHALSRRVVEATDADLIEWLPTGNFFEHTAKWRDVRLHYLIDLEVDGEKCPADGLGDAIRSYRSRLHEHRVAVLLDGMTWPEEVQ